MRDSAIITNVTFFMSQDLSSHKLQVRRTVKAHPQLHIARVTEYCLLLYTYRKEHVLLYYSD